MRNLSSDRFIPTNVLIRFEDGSELVTVPRGATLAYISETLSKAEPVAFCGEALSIDVHFQASRKAGAATPLPLTAFPCRVNGRIAHAGVGLRD